MEACNEVVDQLRALDEAEQRVEEYRHVYLERVQNLVSDKDAWIKTWQIKVRRRWGAGWLAGWLALFVFFVDDRSTVHQLA